MNRHRNTTPFVLSLLLSCLHVNSCHSLGHVVQQTLSSDLKLDVLLHTQRAICIEVMSHRFYLFSAHVSPTTHTCTLKEKSVSARSLSSSLFQSSQPIMPHATFLKRYLWTHWGLPPDFTDEVAGSKGGNQGFNPLEKWAHPSEKWAAGKLHISCSQCTCAASKYMSMKYMSKVLEMSIHCSI